jgi:DNA-binding HxlR family transcriptional regulator
MTLSLQLKQLEEDGLISRSVHGEKPPIKVIYQLIDFGKTFIPALEAINNWGHQIIMDERWKHMKELS